MSREDSEVLKFAINENRRSRFRQTEILKRKIRKEVYLMSKCIPFPAYHDFAPIDISYLFADEKPAGKHGFLTVQGDRFVFEDGKKVRF